MKEFDVIKKPEKDLEQIIDELSDGTVQSNRANTIEELENTVNQILATLPRLDRAKLRLEMENMSVELKENPTTYDLSKGLAKAQAYKDRLSEIYIMALREYKIRQRCAELLLDAFNLVSKGSSVDKRRGDAMMKYPMMLIQMEAAEVFLKEVENVIQNMKSTMEAISRQVSIMQLQLQLGEIRKNQQTNNSEAEEYSSSQRGTTLTPKSENAQLDWSDI